MAKNLLAKAGRVQVPPTKTEAPVVSAGGMSAPSVVAKPKTAPGTLMGFMANQSEAMKENELLRQQATRFEGAAPTRLIDPHRIVPSRWANRHESSFKTEEFVALKEEIAHANGNVQPIKVRPLGAVDLKGVGPSYPPSVEPAFEIVFGHRRHQACLELGIPVLALVDATSEQELFVQMERENRNRADLSAWEQGVMYMRALDQGLYSSNRQLAAAIGRDVADVGKAISLARLPLAVIQAFKSPLELQFRWAKPLNDIQQSDPEGLLRRAKAVAGKGLSSKEVLLALTAPTEISAGAHSGSSFEVKQEGVTVATITKTGTGLVNVKFAKKMNDGQIHKLQQLLEDFFTRG